MPVTTSSAEARSLYEKGMQDYENLYLERCNDDWRAAVKADPSLAVAWAWIAFNSSNPQEVSAAREKAKALAPKLTPGERLMVEWIAKVQEGDFIGGISAMNDMLEMFPKDKHLLYLAGNWLMGENGTDQAQRLFEKALAIDKNFPRRAERPGLRGCPQPAIRQGLCRHGSLYRAPAQRTQSAGLLRRIIAHGRKLRRISEALPSRVEHRS